MENVEWKARSSLCKHSIGGWWGGRGGGGLRPERQRDADQTGRAWARGWNFHFAGMGLDDFVGHGQAKAQAHIAGGEKRLSGLAGGLGAEAGPAVLHFNLRPARAGGVGFGRSEEH